MKRHGITILKVLLCSILILSATRLASVGAGLLRDREQFEEIKPETDWTVAEPSDAGVPAMEETEDIQEQNGLFSKDFDAPDTGDDTPAASDDAEEVHDEDEDPENRTDTPAVTGQNIERFSSILARNPDFAAWIKIPDTMIDYPVMISPRDPDFYLHHDFNKNDSLSGVPYIGKNCSLTGDNIILYSHNMKNGTMFSSLLLYAGEDYYRKHPEVFFDTVTEDGTYEIIAVFREKVHYQDETDVFRYYDYSGDLSEERFQEYLGKIKAISLYETGKTAVYGQQLLTLSTCSYHTENGRFVVVAARL